MKMKSFQFAKLTESATAILRKVSDAKSASAELIPFLCAWFPIRTEQTAFAVVELLGRHSWKRDERFIEALTVLGFELGKACASLSQGYRPIGPRYN